MLFADLCNQLKDAKLDERRRFRNFQMFLGHKGSKEGKKNKGSLNISLYVYF